MKDLEPLLDGSKRGKRIILDYLEKISTWSEKMNQMEEWEAILSGEEIYLSWKSFHCSPEKLYKMMDNILKGKV